MQEKIENPDKRRTALRYPTEVVVACRPFTSRGGTCSADAVMRNFSKAGAYIETSHEFKIGTILQMRMVQYPSTLQSLDSDDQPRSIGLVAVKWRQQLAAENARPYGFGLKHLD